MRVLVAASILLLAGCLDDGQTDETELTPEATAEFEPVQHSESFSILLGVNPSGLPMVVDDPYHYGFPFEVPEEASLLEVSTDWSCITLCPMDVWIEDPEGNTVAREYTWGWDFEQEDPAPGSWTFKMMTAELDVSVGVDGSVTFVAS